MTEPVDMLFVPVIRRANHVVRFVGGREWVVPLGDAERIVVEYADARVAEATADLRRELAIMRSDLQTSVQGYNDLERESDEVETERDRLREQLERERSIRATAEEIAESSRHFDWAAALAKSDLEARRLREQLTALRQPIRDSAQTLYRLEVRRQLGTFNECDVDQLRDVQHRLAEIANSLGSEVTETSPESTCPLCNRPESDNFRSDQIISCSHAFHAPKSDPRANAASEDTEPGSPTGLWRELEDAKRSWEQMPEWVKRQSQPLFDAHERAVAKHRAAVSDLVAGTEPGLYVYPPTNREPQPSDGPEYHADHAAWEERNAVADPQVCALCGCSCGRCRHRDGGDDHTRECKERFWREQDACLDREVSPEFRTRKSGRTDRSEP